MDNPVCPFCRNETIRISDNESYEAWGCESCLVYINKSKLRPAAKPDTMTKVSDIQIKTGG